MIFFILYRLSWTAIWLIYEIGIISLWVLFEPIIDFLAPISIPNVSSRLLYRLIFLFFFQHYFYTQPHLPLLRSLDKSFNLILTENWVNEKLAFIKHTQITSLLYCSNLHTQLHMNKPPLYFPIKCSRQFYTPLL